MDANVNAITTARKKRQHELQLLIKQSIKDDVKTSRRYPLACKPISVDDVDSAKKRLY